MNCNPICSMLVQNNFFKPSPYKQFCAWGQSTWNQLQKLQDQGLILYYSYRSFKTVQKSTARIRQYENTTSGGNTLFSNIQLAEFQLPLWFLYLKFLFKSFSFDWFASKACSALHSFCLSSLESFSKRCFTAIAYEENTSHFICSHI